MNWFWLSSVSHSRKTKAFWILAAFLVLAGGGAVVFWRPVTPPSPDRIEAGVRRVEGSTLPPASPPDDTGSRPGQTGTEGETIVSKP